MPKINRFVVIGVSLLLTTIAFYAALNRWLWPEGPSWAHFGIVSIVMTTANYVLNSRVTFEAKHRNVAMKFRFLIVIGLATLLNNALFWIFHEWFGLPDLVVIVMNAAIIAGCTFTGHRFFTFAESRV